MKISKVVVLGAGTMGNGIVQVIAQAGYQVAMRDVSDSVLTQGEQSIERSLSKLVAKKVISAEEKTNIISRITTTTSTC